MGLLPPPFFTSSFSGYAFPPTFTSPPHLFARSKVTSTPRTFTSTAGFRKCGVGIAVGGEDDEEHVHLAGVAGRSSRRQRAATSADGHFPGQPPGRRPSSPSRPCRRSSESVPFRQQNLRAQLAFSRRGSSRGPRRPPAHPCSAEATPCRTPPSSPPHDRRSRSCAAAGRRSAHPLLHLRRRVRRGDVGRDVEEFGTRSTVRDNVAALEGRALLLPLVERPLRPVPLLRLPAVVHVRVPAAVAQLLPAFLARFFHQDAVCAIVRR